MVATLSSDESPAIGLYNRYVNTSSYLRGLVELSAQLASMMHTYDNILTRDNMGNLTTAISNNADTVEQLANRLLAYGNWINGK